MAARSAFRWLTSLTRLRVRDSSPPRPRSRRRLWLEQLEDRVTPARYAVNLLDQVALLDGPGPDRSRAAGRREVVFYETSVADYEALLTGAAPGTDQVLLDARGDGLRQMAAFLAEHTGYDAVAVVAHGAAGQLVLGAAPLDANTLADYDKELATLAAALNPQGDLLLYGCDVAAGAEGEAFVRQLASATGADVAAARHRVGAAALGGSWQLDYQTGPIETDLPFAADQFPGVLPADQQNREGDAVALPVAFDAPAGTTLHFTAANLPNGLSLTTLDASTTQVTGTIAAGAAINAPFATRITASDVPPGQPGTYSSDRTFTWNVSPRITVSWIDDQENLEGDTVSLPVTATSPDGRPLTFTASDLPNGLSLTAVDATSARITGTIAVAAADTGFFETTVTASDGTYSGSHTWYWFVAADPPDLTVGPDRTVAAGTPITLQASATDPDGIASVEWWFSFNGEDYEWDPDLTSLTIQYTFPTYGEYDVLVVVTDGNGDSSTDGFHVTVTETAPSANLVTASGPVIRGNAVTFTAAAIDPDALDTVSLYVDWQGTGPFDQLDVAQLEPNPDGSFSFAHVYPRAGNFTTVLRIADDNGEDTD